MLDWKKNGSVHHLQARLFLQKSAKYLKTCKPNDGLVSSLKVVLKLNLNLSFLKFYEAPFINCVHIQLPRLSDVMNLEIYDLSELLTWLCEFHELFKCI